MKKLSISYKYEYSDGTRREIDLRREVEGVSDDLLWQQVSEDNAYINGNLTRVVLFIYEGDNRTYYSKDIK